MAFKRIYCSSDINQDMVGKRGEGDNEIYHQMTAALLTSKNDQKLLAFATPLFRLQKKSAVYVRGKKRRVVVVAVVVDAVSVAAPTTNTEDFAAKKICIVILSKFTFRRNFKS
jgi:hypothetical protein